jgi:hypothetical protein
LITEGWAYLPQGLKLAAVYFLVAGGVSFVWPLLGYGPPSPEFEAKTLAFKLGAYLRESLVGTAYFVTGVSILLRLSWAPYLAYVALGVATFYTAHQYLRSHVAGYAGAAQYVDAPAVRDGGLITASGLADVEFTRELFEELNVLSAEDRDAWATIFRSARLPAR